MSIKQRTLDRTQAEKVERYQSKISGCSKSKAVEELEKHSWNLQLAFSSINEPPAGSSSGRCDTNQTLSLSPIRDESEHSDSRLRGLMLRCVCASFKLISLVANSCLVCAHSIWRLSVAIVRSIMGMLSSEDPRKLNNKLVEEFSNTYGTIHPEFCNYSYSVSLRIAMHNQKIVLVYIHDAASEEATTIARTVICSEDMTKYAKMYDIMLYMCDTRSPEYVNILRNSPFVNELPSLFIRAPDHNITTMRFHRVSEYSFKGIVASLDAVIGSCPPVLQRDWQRRKHNEDSRLIREEREAAYRISLESDALKEMKLKQKINKKTQKEHSDSLKIKQWEVHRAQLLESLPEEPSAKKASDPAFKDSIVRLKITLPSDKRVERKFWKTQTVEDLYNFVKTQDLSPLTPLDNFYLSSVYPPKVFVNRFESLEDSGLFPTGNVIVEEDLDESSSYEEDSSATGSQ